MKLDQINHVIERVNQSNEPRIEIIRPAETRGPRLGVFASSFNPPTLAHVELIRRASEAFSLDETLALTGQANADKMSYECPLGDRVAMMELAFAGDRHTSIGLSSHAFYVDMIDALERVYPARADLHFIVGFDTFERVLDFDDRYTERYYRQFSGRLEALEYLFARCNFIVSARAGSGHEQVTELIAREPAAPKQRIHYLDFPSDLGELSATEVRNRCQTGESIEGLVPGAIAGVIQQRGLYGIKGINAQS
jgi:nicotinamide-nucleotide adenylyltransferase